MSRAGARTASCRSSRQALDERGRGAGHHRRGCGCTWPARCPARRWRRGGARLAAPAARPGRAGLGPHAAACCRRRRIGRRRPARRTAPAAGCPLQHLAYPAPAGAGSGSRCEQALAEVPGTSPAASGAALPALAAAARLPQPGQIRVRPGWRPAGPARAGGLRPAIAPSRRPGRAARWSSRSIDEVADRAAGAAGSSARFPPSTSAAAPGILRYVVLRANAAGQVLVTLVAARPLARWPGAGRRAAGSGARRWWAWCRPEPRSRATSSSRPPAPAPIRCWPAQAELREDIGGRGGGDRAAQLPAAEPGGGRAGLRRHPRFAGGGPGTAGRVVDLYAGRGGGVVSSARPGAAVIRAIEENPAATAAGSRAAAGAGRDESAVRHRRRRPTASIADWLPGADLVVLNPPRGGAAAAAAGIAAVRPGCRRRLPVLQPGNSGA